MTKQQIFVLLFTFVVGLFSGFYIYITGFAPDSNRLPDEQAVRESSLTIRGEQVGGCQMAGFCAAFELTSNRKYEYTSAHSFGEQTPESLKGQIDRNVYAELVKIVNRSDLTDLQKPGDICQAAVDGIDYRYDIIVDGVSYELNSCGTQFYGSLLYNELLRLWGLMLKAEAEDDAGSDLRALLIDWFPRSEVK